MTFLHSIILGIVEGITEFLPISSTAHLFITEHLLGLSLGDFEKTFAIAIQLGAILSVLALYWRSFLDIEVLKRVVVAFVPTAVIGLVLYKIVKMFLLGNFAVIAWALIIGGIVLIVFERYHLTKVSAEEKTIRDITYTQAALVGVAQSIAMIPGVSRSGASIVGGVLVGIPRTVIVEFSFLLAVPTMMAATLLDILKMNAVLTGNEAGLLLMGGIVSFIVAIFAIRWLLKFVRTYSFVGFGWYRIVVGALLIFFLR